MFCTLENIHRRRFSVNDILCTGCLCLLAETFGRFQKISELYLGENYYGT